MIANTGWQKGGVAACLLAVVLGLGAPTGVRAAEGAALGVASTTSAAAGVAEFPRYPALVPSVKFWTDVFATYSENQSAIHSSRYPSKVFEVLDFRADALRLDANRLDRLRANQERAAKVRADTLLRAVHALRNTPEQMTAEQRTIFDLYSDIPSDRRFLDAVGTLRAQRGLRERTEAALQVSGRYLPVMEATFTGYGLPLPLTRLPLLESSFNVEAYSKVGAAGLWQFMPSSARIYMRLDEVVDDRRDPWSSTDGAARHLRDDYKLLKSWPLALTAYNHGRSGVARALKNVNGDDLMDLIERHESPRWGFASRNFYAEFLAVVDIEGEWQNHYVALERHALIQFETVETQHYVPYQTLTRLSGVDPEQFRALNPAYRDEVVAGELHVPPGHVIRVPAGAAQDFQLGYAALGTDERFDQQKHYFIQHKVRPGESIGRLASRYGTSQKAIQDLNGIRNASLIRVGQVLKIPSRGSAGTRVAKAGAPASQPESASAEAVAPASFKTHKVRSGQTLQSIARLHQVPAARIQKVNAIRDANLIRVGQTLKIPVG